MNAVYKLDCFPQEDAENSYNNSNNLITLNSCSKIIELPELQFELESNADDEDDVEEKEKKVPVQPLIGIEIQKAKMYLLNKPERYKGNKIKNYTLFCLGVAIGLRISDLLNLKIHNVVKNGKIRDSIILTEEKTKNRREVFLRPSIKQILVDYINSIEDWKYNYFLFHPRNNYYTKMGVRNVNYMMKDIQRGLGLNFDLGTHSLRKTFARAVFDLFTVKDNILALENLQNILGHKDVSTTRRYIGLQREGNKDIYTNEDLCI